MTNSQNYFKVNKETKQDKIKWNYSIQQLKQQNRIKIYKKPEKTIKTTTK